MAVAKIKSEVMISLTDVRRYTEEAQRRGLELKKTVIIENKKENENGK